MMRMDLVIDDVAYCGCHFLFLSETLFVSLSQSSFQSETSLYFEKSLYCFFLISWMLLVHSCHICLEELLSYICL